MTDLYQQLAAEGFVKDDEVERPVMPQIDEHDYPALLRWLDTHGVTVSDDMIEPSRLCFRQRVDQEMVASILTRRRDLLNKRIILSNERCVLDGNHRAAAHLAEGTPSPAYVLGVSFEEGFDLLCAFGRVHTLREEGGKVRN